MREIEHREKRNNRPKISICKFIWTTSVYKTKNLFRTKQAWKSSNEKNEQRMGWAIKIIERRNERSCREGGGWSICTFVYMATKLHTQLILNVFYFLLDFWWYFWEDFFVVAFLSAQCCSRQRIIPVCRCHLKWTQRMYSSYQKCICVWKITKMYI